MTTSQNKRVITRLQTEAINACQWLEKAEDPTAGATTAFIGKVRNHDPEAGDTAVTAIEYTAHPDAPAALQKGIEELVEGALIEDSGAAANVSVLVVHRVGHVSVGEVALLVIVSSPHRSPSMELTPLIVERVKQTLPIWKKQVLENGESAWSNLP